MENMINMEDIDISRVHFIGIGGAGMSGLARILLSRGSSVSGSDVNDSRVLLALKTMGAQVYIGHDASHIGDATVVVVSFAAIPQDNPELIAAHEKGIPIIYRSDLLALLMQDHAAVLLAGTHGKTSTTSMTVVGLQDAGLDPSFAIGGQLNKSGTNAHQGTDSIFVAEADESDASFLKYSPTVAVVTNIEADHLDFYGTEEAYHKVFREFITRIIPGGSLIICLEDPDARALGQWAQDNYPQIHVYGYGSQESSQGSGIPLLVELVETHTQAGRDYATVRLHLEENEKAWITQISDISFYTVGRHMILNACAALAASIVVTGKNTVHSQEEKVQALAAIEEYVRGISGFTGVRRRFEYKGTIESGPFIGVSVYDDYAHHPTEVEAVLRAARHKISSYSDEEAGRLIAIFQPHLYSRTINFAQEFASALSIADEVIILDIYAAREKPVEGVDGRIISEKITVPVHYEPDFSKVAHDVRTIAQPKDMIITIGAGSVTLLGQEIMDELS